MGVIKLDGLPIEQPAAEPWPVDEHTIRVDEMFARQLDNAFSAGVRGLLHDPETGISAQSGEAALEAIAGAMPALMDLKERALAGAVGPRQRSIIEPLIETRLDGAAGTLGRLAQRATVEVDDQSVADRIAGLNRDAAAAWQDPAYLRRLGRTAVEELRYQGERCGWDAADTDAKVRGSLSDLYAGAVETAIGQDDLDGAAGLYDHAREVIDPERRTLLDRRFVQAREAAVYRDVDRDMAGIPIDPAGPPGAAVFAERAAELTPDDASDEVRAGIAEVGAFAQRRAERQWQKQQAEAGVAALDWLKRNPEASLVTVPLEVRDWLAPDQWKALTRAAIAGRVETDSEIHDRLDRQAVYEPQVFAGLDLDRHRLTLDDQDFSRLAAIQQAKAEGRTDPTQARWGHTLTGLDRALEAKGIDLESPAAREARSRARDRLDSFETIEGRPPRGADLDEIVQRTAEPLVDRRGIAPNVEPSSESPDVPTDEETTPSSSTTDAEANAPPEAGGAPSDDVPAASEVGPASTETPAIGPTDDGPTPSFAGDPNIIRVGAGNSTSRRGGGGRPLTPIEEMRGRIFEAHREALERLEPKNPELVQVAPPGAAPSRDAVARMRQELLNAQARAAGGLSAIPSGTGEVPGSGRLERPLGIPRDWQVIPSRKRDGVTYMNPNNEHDHVRIMPGDPNSPYPHQRRPYVIDRNWGGLRDKNGQPVGGPDSRRSPDAHIPYDDYIFWR